MTRRRLVIDSIQGEFDYRQDNSSSPKYFFFGVIPTVCYYLDILAVGYSTTNMRRRDMQIEIDKELSIYEQRILELKMRRNTYTDISTLPSELLVGIFLLVQASRPLKEWHRITHVCRHWRDTAINTPILWTKPPTRNEHYTSLMLERSKIASLNILLDSQVSTSAVTSISGHIGRIQTLEMVLRTDQLTNTWDRLGASSQVFSRLESLDIERPWWRHNTTNWTLPSTIIERTTLIHSLHLKRITFDWQILAALNLTSLQLTDVRLTEQVSSEKLLQTLRQMPRLHHLALNLVDLLFPIDVPTMQFTIVPLLFLQSLDVSDYNHRHIPFLLSHLSLPRLNNLSIHSRTAHDNESYFSNALTTIATILTNGNFQVSGSLYIERSYIRISAPNKILVSITLPQVSNTDHEIQCSREFLRQIIPIFHGLVQLRLVVPLTSDELVQMFGNLHQLKAVIIYEHNTLISALTGALAHDSGHGVPTFSSLDTIGCDDVDWDGIDRNMVVDFCNALLQRSQHTTAIKTIYCFDNPPPQWAIDLLVNGGICVEDAYIPSTYGF